MHLSYVPGMAQGDDSGRNQIAPRNLLGQVFHRIPLSGSLEALSRFIARARHQDHKDPPMRTGQTKIDCALQSPIRVGRLGFFVSGVCISCQPNFPPIWISLGPWRFCWFLLNTFFTGGKSAREWALIFRRSEPSASYFSSFTRAWF